MLNALQAHLAQIYEIDSGPAIETFLLSPEQCAALEGSAGTRAVREKVLIAETDEALELGVFVDPGLLQRLHRANPFDDLSDDVLPDLLLALEGVSHFNYLVFNSRRETAVSLLELELQAEIDKFVATLFLADEHGYGDVADKFLKLQFERCSFDEALSGQERERYVVASRYAARFCRALKLFDSGDHYRSLAELRGFYRLGRPAKVSRINALGH